MRHKTTTKKDAMAMIKALKEVGAPVTKDSIGGYWLRDKAGKKLFAALPGTKTWLVSYVPGLFK